MRRIWYSRWRWALLGALAAVSVLVVGIVGGIIHDDEDGDGKQGSPTVAAASPTFSLASPKAQSPTATPVSAGETPEATAPSAASPTEASTSVPAIPTSADRIRLSVHPGASAAQDWAVWLDPRIER